MGWLYVPGTRVWKSGSDVPDFPSDSSATWRGKPMQLRTWRALWKRPGWILHLSGMISQRSMLESGVSIYRSSLPAGLASPSQQLAKDRTSKIRVGSGAILLGSFATFDRPSCSWRMSQGSLFADSLPFSQPLPHWGSMRNGALYERKTPARLTDARACLSSRRTPTKDDPSSGDLWPTPDALARERINGGDWSPDTEHRAKAGQGIVERPTLALLATMWPTPTTTDSRSAARHTTQTGIMNAGTTLTDAMRTHLRQGTSKGGSSTSDRVVLRPEFVEAIMGLPTAWTACDYSETV